AWAAPPPPGGPPRPVAVCRVPPGGSGPGHAAGRPRARRDAVRGHGRLDDAGEVAPRRRRRPLAILEVDLEEGARARCDGRGLHHDFPERVSLGAELLRLVRRAGGEAEQDAGWDGATRTRQVYAALRIVDDHRDATHRERCIP